MPFGLNVAPATFQRLMNDILRGYLNTSLAVYLNDVLIYIRTRSEHVPHDRQVLQVLRDNNLHGKLSKCHFFQNEVKFFGLYIGEKVLRMDPEKIKTIVQWGPPTCVADSRSFTGFTGFYRRFIDNNLGILAPINALEKKGVAFNWTK